MSPAWRWRRCPRCSRVERASDYLALRPYQGRGTGAVEQQCPNSGHETETWRFSGARERSAARGAVPAVVSSVGRGSP